MTRLMANGGALLNSVMCRVSKVPDIKDCVEPEGCRCFFFAAFGVSLTAQRPVQLQGKEGCCGLYFAALFSSKIQERPFSARS